MSDGRTFARYTRTGLAVLTGVLALGAGCAAWRTPPVAEPAAALRPVWRAPTLRDDGDPASLRAAVAESLAWLATQPADHVFVAGPRRVTVAEQTRALQALLAVLREAPEPSAWRRTSAERSSRSSARADRTEGCW